MAEHGNVPAPPWLATAVSAAIDLDQLREAGAVFIYPDGLSTFQWDALRGLQRGRALYRERHQRGKDGKCGCGREH